MAVAWADQLEGIADITKGYKVVDCDTHLSEAPDLWTSRAPAKYKDRVPHLGRAVTDVDPFGNPRGHSIEIDRWFIEGDRPFGGFGACVVAPDGGKVYGKVSYDQKSEMHPGAWRVQDQIGRAHV